MANTVLVKVVKRASEFVQLFLGDTLKRKENQNEQHKHNKKGLSKHGDNKHGRHTVRRSSALKLKKEKKIMQGVQRSDARL